MSNGPEKKGPPVYEKFSVPVFTIIMFLVLDFSAIIAIETAQLKELYNSYLLYFAYVFGLASQIALLIPLIKFQKILNKQESLKF